MRYERMPIEVESPEEFGYGNIRNNLSESSITDRRISDFGLQIPDLTLLYNEHRGSPALRDLIVADEPGLGGDDVLVTNGAAGALFIIATTLLSAADHLVVVRPNYATNLETPRAIGCAITTIELSFDNRFALDLAEVEKALRPNTRAISVTTPHNPTGVRLSHAEVEALAALARRHGCRLIVDETYRDLTFGTLPPLASSIGPEVVSVSSLSKAYGAPGLRLGWIVCRDAELMERFLAAKEQISICGCVIHEWLAEQILARRTDILGRTKAEMAERFGIVRKWMETEELLEWVEPSGGVVCLPRMKAEPAGGTDAFYRRLLEDHGTYVGPGRWFEMPDTYFRLGYGWSSVGELHAGLDGISKALRGSL